MPCTTALSLSNFQLLPNFPIRELFRYSSFASFQIMSIFTAVSKPAMNLVPPPKCLKDPPYIPKKLLLGPGPSNAPSDIVNAMTAPMLGHLHSEFTKMTAIIQIMDDVKEGIRYAFQTKNRLTFAVNGTGHAGMECAFVNLVEPDDRVLIVDIGIWGERAAEIANRCDFVWNNCGAKVDVLKFELGTVADLESVQNRVVSFHPHVVFVCHGDSSTGVCQPLQHLGDLCRKHGALLLVDTVASLGGAEFAADSLNVDCVYSAAQKVLNAPPGLAPISFNERAYEKIANRTSKIRSFYFDANLLGNYWGCFNEPRRYHHTAPVSLMYALRAALSRLAAEGLNDSVRKHRDNARYLHQGVEQLGLSLFVTDPQLRLPCLTTIKVPENVDWKKVIDHLMKQKIEIAGGLGATVGKLWRIGTFGTNSSKENIDCVLEALKNALQNDTKLETELHIDAK